MAIIASDKGGGDYQLAPEGNHLGVCVQVIDLGTQVEDYMGNEKKTRKVRIGWELPEEKAVFDSEKGEESFMVSKDYTLSLHEKANLRHDLESWRGRAFDAEELEGFDIAKLLGAAAMVNVVHQVSKVSKRSYVKITTVTRLPKSITKDQVPAPSLPLVQYSIEDGPNAVFQRLPDFLKEKIAGSLEAKDTAGARQHAPGKTQGKTDDDSDEPPF